MSGVKPPNDYWKRKLVSQKRLTVVSFVIGVITGGVACQAFSQAVQAMTLMMR